MKVRPRFRRAPAPSPRPAPAERLDADAFTSTVAKNEFGRLLEMAIRGRPVTITKHGAPKAVLISLEEFTALRHAADSRLDALSETFDAMLAQMQAPKARAGMKAAFDASPKELGKAAVAAARKRG